MMETSCWQVKRPTSIGNAKAATRVGMETSFTIFYLQVGTLMRLPNDHEDKGLRA